jgi:hypothetical protein
MKTMTKNKGKRGNKRKCIFLHLDAVNGDL